MHRHCCCLKCRRAQPGEPDLSKALSFRSLPGWEGDSVTENKITSCLNIMFTQPTKSTFLACVFNLSTTHTDTQTSVCAHTAKAWHINHSWFICPTRGYSFNYINLMAEAFLCFFSSYLSWVLTMKFSLQKDLALKYFMKTPNTQQSVSKYLAYLKMELWLMGPSSRQLINYSIRWIFLFPEFKIRSLDWKPFLWASSLVEIFSHFNSLV